MYKSLRITFVILLCGLSCSIQAQTQTTGILKFNATSAIDIFSFPAPTFSYERVLNKRWTATGELGYQFYAFKNSDTSFIHPRGFRASVSARYYLKKHAPFGLYFEGSAFYRQYKTNNSITYYRRNDPATYTDDMWSAENMTGINFIFGGQHTMGKHFSFDWYAGLGLMYKNLQNHDREYNTSVDSLAPIDGPPLIDLQLSENAGWSPNVTVGCRIGYVFRNNTPKEALKKPSINKH